MYIVCCDSSCVSYCTPWRSFLAALVARSAPCCLCKAFSALVSPDHPPWNVLAHNTGLKQAHTHLSRCPHRATSWIYMNKLLQTISLHGSTPPRYSVPSIAKLPWSWTSAIWSDRIQRAWNCMKHRWFSMHSCLLAKTRFHDPIRVQTCLAPRELPRPSKCITMATLVMQMSGLEQTVGVLDWSTIICITCTHLYQFELSWFPIRHDETRVIGRR